MSESFTSSCSHSDSEYEFVDKFAARRQRTGGYPSSYPPIPDSDPSVLDVDMNLDPPYGHAKSEQLSQVTHGVDPYDLWQLCPRRARMLEKRGFDIGGPQEPINSIDFVKSVAEPLRVTKPKGPKASPKQAAEAAPEPAQPATIRQRAARIVGAACNRIPTARSITLRLVDYVVLAYVFLSLGLFDTDSLQQLEVVCECPGVRESLLQHKNQLVSSVLGTYAASRFSSAPNTTANATAAGGAQGLLGVVVDNVANRLAAANMDGYAVLRVLLFCGACVYIRERGQSRRRAALQRVMRGIRDREPAFREMWEAVEKEKGQ